jgi:uncharacterized membrane protein
MTEWLLGGCCGPGGRLVWTAPSWVPYVVGGLSLALLALAARPVPRGARRLAEIALLGVALATAAFASAGPVWLQEGERVERGRFVVLVDASRSMGVLDADGTPRSAQAASLLERLGTAEVHHFGEGLRSGPPAAYDHGDTDLGGALAAVADRYAGERLEGIAVLTDGLDRGGLRRRLTAGEDASLPRIGGPLTVYAVGQPGARTDVALTDMRGGGFAFLRAPFTLEVDVEAVNVSRRSVPVTLTRDGQPAGRTEVTFGPDGRATARFELTPDAVGRYVYEASVPDLEGDAVPANNALSLGVRVVRDRLRVLQVTGSPSFDQKFLRLFLKEDPSVDLVSFFILRTMRDMGAGWDGSELSLIQFPYERLFSSDLWSFDLVILQNFDYAPYFDFNADELLSNMAQYVRKGGALVMIGGDRSFDLGAYAGTPLAEVLPVKLGVSGDAVDAAAFSPTLTAAGAAHPVTQLVADPVENAAVWKRLAPLDGLNLSMGARPEAAVLLEHPTRSAPGGGKAPVLAVMEVGAGRTMALMGDSSWRWSFGEAGAGQGNQAYLRFYKNAMRWLVGDPEDRPVVVEATRENWRLGETVRVRVHARDGAFNPVPDASIRAKVSGPAGEQTIEAVADADGVAMLDVPATARGAHRVKVEARRGEALLGEAQTVYAVTTRDPELDEVEPDHAFLERLAAEYGGRYVAPGRYEEPTRDADAGRRVRDRKETPLYATPLVPTLFGLAAGLSWWLRRREGLR